MTAQDILESELWKQVFKELEQETVDNWDRMDPKDVEELTKLTSYRQALHTVRDDLESRLEELDNIG